MERKEIESESARRKRRKYQQKITKEILKKNIQQPTTRNNSKVEQP